jgi:hypothetical protein
MLADTPTGNDPRFVEGTVIAVDSKRFVCKVMTDFKQFYDGVPWASNVFDTPVFNDRVRVDNVQGYPIITCILSRVGTPSGFTPNIDTGEGIDTGNYSTLGRGLVIEPNKPEDLVSGDKIVSNEMGGVYGLLKGGTFIARASKLAQILLSKYDDLVRIVGRNYELFTDTFADYAVSVRGRIYRYIGYGDTLENSRGDIHKYQEYYGDVALGQFLGGSYYGVDSGTYPVATDIIRRMLIVGDPNSIFRQDLYKSTGQYHTVVQNAGATIYTYVNQTNGTYDVKTLNGTYTQITTTPTSVIVTYNGTNKVTIDNDKIELDFGGDSKVSVTSSQLELSYNSGAHFIKVDATGTHLG